MRRYKLLLTGLLMVGAGAFLIFSNPQALPLWIVWLAGPFLWYVGIAVSIGGVAFAFFLPLTPREEEALAQKRQQNAEIAVLNMSQFDHGLSRAGLMREIPAMGGFIL